MSLPITSIYAGLMGLWLFYLATRVIGLRRGNKVSLGDGGIGALQAAIRAHGNAAEYIPITLILLGLAEGMGLPWWFLHLCGLALVLGRALHATHFQAADPGFRRRIGGMAMTFGALGVLSVTVILAGVLA